MSGDLGRQKAIFFRAYATRGIVTPRKQYQLNFSEINCAFWSTIANRKIKFKQILPAIR